jgi:thiol:disulfide interchange protein
VRLILKLIIFALASVAAVSVEAAQSRVELIAQSETVKAGDTVLVGVRFVLNEGWHTYWRNPGGPGFGATVKWELPEGVSAGELLWPIPEKLQDETGTWYVYEKEVVLLAPLKISDGFSGSRVEIKGAVSWLECSARECDPRDAKVALTLNIGGETKASPGAGLIEDWQKKLPRPAGDLPVKAFWEGEAGEVRSLILEWPSAQAAPGADFYPDASESFEVQTNIQTVAEVAGKMRLRVPIKKLQGDWPAKISGLVVQRGTGGETGYEISSTIENGGLARTTGDANPLAATPTLWKVLLYAFIGGLILNVMPCVLPVIALKILGFVGEARNAPGRVRALGLVYGLGVLVSFLTLAGFVIAVKAAGHKAGWGMQLANPQFVVGLTVLVTLVALNLFGLFEVTVSGKVIDSAGDLASKHGVGGAFFNGVLATILGAPCTAPFLGFALGFAFAQSASIILLVFATIAFGMAFPYVLLSWHPAWLKALPKPGQWMVRFKIAMGFPMLATAFWLFSLLSVHYGQRAWWVGVFLIIVALAAWAYGEFLQRGRVNRGAAFAFILVLLAGGYFGVLEKQVQWRSPITASEKCSSSANAPAGLAWEPWGAEAVASARKQGRPVVVDFTAQWCATCNVSVKPALENEKVVKRLKELNAVLLVGDYTRTPPVITEELNRFGRAGVPLVLVYSKNGGEPPQVLPEPLPFSDYSAVILSALEKAGG